MIKSVSIFFILLFVCGFSFVQEVTTINGVAPGFLGEKVEIYRYVDYLSFKEEKLGEAQVQTDSSFSVSFFSDTITKVSLKINNTFLESYIEPGKEYEVFIDGNYQNDFKDKGKRLDLDFFYLDLDSNDINYKILDFDNKLYQFLEKNFTHQKRSSGDFALALEDFKNKISDDVNNSASSFFKIYAKFAIAQIDNLPFNGSRNRYEKYDFYIKPETVWFHNDRYMEYINHYYKSYIGQIPERLNEKFYEGVIESSPSKLMNILGKDYALDNLKLREYILIKMLSELYYDEEFPETNIRVILDSLSNRSMFPQNQVIAGNVYDRLTDLVPGGKLPQFFIKSDEGISYTNRDLLGKHTYIHFLSLDSKTSQKDIKLLRHLHDKYFEDVNFVSFIAVPDGKRKEVKNIFTPTDNEGKWDLFFLEESNAIFDKFKVNNFPLYVMTDAEGTIISVPALTPRPNNEYETIERTFFNLQKIRTNKEKK